MKHMGMMYIKGDIIYNMTNNGNQWDMYAYNIIYIYIYTLFFTRYDLIIYTSSARTRRGGSCLRDICIRPFSLIALACAVHQPSPCVRALCESGVLLHMSHLKLHFALHTSECTLHTPHFTLHTPHFTLHSSHSTLHTPNFTLHSPHFTLLTAFFTLHSTLHTSHSTLHTALFTPHTSHCTLHTPHVISSELFSPYPSSSLLICHLSFHESLPSTTYLRRAPARPVCACFVRSCCCVVPEHDLRATLVQCKVKQTLSSHFTLHSSHPTLHTSHFTLALHLNSSHLSSSHLIPCLPICQLSSSWLFSCQLLPSTDIYDKSLQKLLPSTICTTKLAKSTSQ